MKLRKLIALSLITFLSLTAVNAQEDDPILPYKVAPQNLLKFNRFLINPTFTTVREDKSYINLLHRNQSVQFQDNDQTYFLSYSGRMGDRSGLGLSLYTQKLGPIQNIGVLANYAYGIKLSDKSNFTFGGNLAYYSTGLNRNNVDVVDINDFRLNGTEDSNILSFQPGFNLSYGQFDLGMYAENLFDYNLKTSKTLTEFSDKTYSAHLQYTYEFKNDGGLLESARLMPLARVRLNTLNQAITDNSQNYSLGGSLILDLPKLGWLQGGYDNFYGASAGAGFNINRRMSLGYTMEKGFGTDFNNLGLTHEISFAYSFTPNLSEDRVMLEADDELVENNELDPDTLASNDELEELKKKLAENEEVLAELMFRQDSLEKNRQGDLERRFEMVMRMVRNETNGTRPDLEEKAKKYFINNDKNAFADNDSADNVLDRIKERSKNASSNTGIDNSYVTKSSTTIKKDAVSQATKPVAQKIKSRKFKNLDGVADGYYLVANVYKGQAYMNKFMSDMDAKGIKADYIANPHNGLKYVYLEKYNTLEEAEEAHKSNLNGKYHKKMWIMDVNNSGYSNERYATLDKLKQKSSNSNKSSVTKIARKPVSRDRLATRSKAPRSTTVSYRGVDSGYYIIASVFANPNNAKRFVKMLNQQGLNASYFINPKNNYRYVYLKKHGSWSNALLSYYSKINNSYNDEMWIMRVTPNLTA